MSHVHKKAVLALLPVLLLAACGKKVKTPQRQTAIPKPIGWTETGIASWYGHPYHGRRAANGEIYDMEKLTAAHQTLPFETWVRVRNLVNLKWVEVRITDRGPFIDGRIIDLSRAAAEKIEMIGPGIQKVRIEVIEAPRTPEAIASTPQGRFAVQVASFRRPDQAEELQERIRDKFGASRIVEATVDGGPVWRVLVGDEADREKADDLARKIRRDREGIRDAFVVRLSD